MTTSIQLLRIGELDVYFFFDQNHLPSLDIEGTTYQSLCKVLQQFPQIATPLQADKMAQLSNFLVKGLAFHFIDDILKFQEDYAQRLDTERFEPGQKLPFQNSYGTYDVSIMHPPQLKAQELIFFVSEDYTKIPYRVLLNYSLQDEHFMIKYELLPYL